MKQQKQYNNMDKVTILIRTTQEDDSFASETNEYRVFPNHEKAKELVIYLLCKNFNLPSYCTTFAYIANELALSGIYCRVTGDNKIEWWDNGKGETYLITTIDINNDNEFHFI